MLKNSNQNSINNETHFSHNEYQYKKGKRTYKDFTVFISVLVIGILIFLGFAKILSPNVDVGIADDDEFSQFEDDSSSSSSAVDERLKGIQDEDDGKSGDDSMFSPELDEKVVLPHQRRKTVGEMEAEMQNAKLQQNKAEAPDSVTPQKASVRPQENKHNEQAAAPAAAPVNVRVVVGSYATEKQAEVAKSIMQDAGLGITPVVKNIGGTYTLQVGSYSSVDKARQSANSLLRSNFPARIVE